MSRLEYLLASAAPAARRAVLLACSRCAATGSCWPRPGSRRSTATSLYIHRAMRRARIRSSTVVLLLEPYSYGLAGKLAYLVRLVRGMYHLQTARPVRRRQRVPADPRRAASAGHDGRPGLARGGRAQALRARHADAAGRAGADVPAPLLRLRSWSAASGRDGRMPRPLRTPGRAGPAARLAAHGLLLRRRRAGRRARPGPGRVIRRCAGRRVVVYAPTFRGRGIGKRAAPGLDAVALRAALPADHALVLKTHPNLDPAATATGRLRRRRRPGAPRSTTCSPRPTSSSPTTRRRSSSSRCSAARSCCSCGDLADVRARSRAVPRLPDRDDRDPGRRHGRGHRRDRDGAVRPVRLRRLHRAPARGIAAAAPASASSSTSCATVRASRRRGDTLPPDVRHE